LEQSRKNKENTREERPENQKSKKKGAGKTLRRRIGEGEKKGLIRGTGITNKGNKRKGHRGENECKQKRIRGIEKKWAQNRRWKGKWWCRS